MTTTVRSILKDYGIHPRKRLGQSFLEDKNIINKIIRIADIRAHDVVVEIGAGLGIMTEQLALQARHVIAIDVDPRMAAILRARLQDKPQVEIIEQDILTFDFSLLCNSDNHADKLKIIGNIPYNISGPILFRLIKYRRQISEMVLLLQKEVADRLTALPGSKEYGIPTVMVDMYTKATKEMNVPAGCFYPPPQVTSSLVKLLTREEPLVRLTDEDFFSRVVKCAFSQRRKTLLNNLRHRAWPGLAEAELVRVLIDLGIDGQRRGETLSALEFGKLSNTLLSYVKTSCR